jgi:hypothetical protein
MGTFTALAFALDPVVTARLRAMCNRHADAEVQPGPGSELSTSLLRSGDGQLRRIGSNVTGDSRPLSQTFQLGQLPTFAELGLNIAEVADENGPSHQL